MDSKENKKIKLFAVVFILFVGFSSLVFNSYKDNTSAEVRK